MSVSNRPSALAIASPSRRRSTWLAAIVAWLWAVVCLPAQPVNAPLIALDELKPGQKGEVWTVFQGHVAEPFMVEVTGVVRNALGPGKSLILCQLTDPRVQPMGAVAGMSGSPLYIDGKLAGALSYQVQRFETVRYAGFTPIADLLEVQAFDRKPGEPEGLPGVTLPTTPLAANGAGNPYQALTPVFAFGGIAPNVAALFEERFRALGLSVSALSGYTTATSPTVGATSATPATLRPGEAVAAALAIGDITLAGTGTVSHVQGNQVLAFGHPMLGLGAVEVPMAAAEIVAILPSNLSSFKISNTGGVIGTIRQDRLSAIYGELGEAPAMLPISIKTPARTLNFSVLRHPRLSPTIAATALTQAILGSNEAALNEGFRVTGTATFPGGETLVTDTLFAGPQAYAIGLDAFLRRLGTWLQNPVTQLFPASIAFDVIPVSRNPASTLDIFQVSRRSAQPGEAVTVSLTTRDFQAAATRETVSFAVPPEWSGRNLEVIVASGPELDRLSGHPETVAVSQIRDIEAYLSLLRTERRMDGLYVAVVERTTAIMDQTTLSLELPSSLERIARASDDARYQRRDILVPLWEQHVLPDRLFTLTLRRPLTILE